jgi:outer membrane receptor protein involved in Fe transport
MPSRDVLSRHLLILILLLGAASSRASGVDGTLEDVLVTATLRPMPDTAVAGSLTVLEGEALRQGVGQHLEDVLAEIPNLSWAGDSARPRYFQLRGIGELEQYEGAPNPSVGFLIDDIDFSGLGNAATLFDVERVEVLRGPQALRYGASALAGLISVTSAAPDAAAGGRFETSLESYGTRSIGAVASAPLPSLASEFRIAAQRYTGDGYYYNDWLRRDDTNTRDESTVRGRWRFQPSDDLRLDLAVHRIRLDDGYDAFSPENRRTTHSDRPGVDSLHATGTSLHLDYLGWRAAEVTAIATYADSRIRYGYDGDWGNPAYWAPYVYDFSELQTRHRKTSSAEVRVASRGEPVIGWLAGAYAMRLTEAFEDLAQGLSVDPVYGSYTQDTLVDSRYRQDRVALFGTVDARRGRWHGALGARLEHQAARYSDRVQDLVAASEDRHNFGPGETLWGADASIAFDAAPGSTAYLDLARGYKAGGFNLSQGLAPEEIRFRAESDWNLELGYKHHPPGSRVSVDADVYLLERHDAQVKTSVQTDPTNPNTFILYTGNAARGRNVGAEATLRWRPAARLLLGASLGLQHTRFTDFVRIADTGSIRVSRELPHAPHWQAALNATYRAPGGFYARVDLTGTAGFYFDLPPNDTRAGGYGLVHARLGWDFPRWSVSAWGRNLANRDYPVRGFYFGLEPPDYPNKLYVQLGEPRTFGANLTVRFGAEAR